MSRFPCPADWLAQLWSKIDCVGCGEQRPSLICAPCLGRSDIRDSFRPIPRAGSLDFEFAGFMAPYAAQGAPTPVAKALLRFKYGGDRACGHFLKRLFAEAAVTLPAGFDLVVPVPLHPSRLRLRGYNHAAWLARAAARRLGIRLDAAGLTRVVDTPAQAGSSRQQRQGFRNAFVAEPSRVRDRRILLVDDVYTTGATAADARRALERSGASGVALAVLLAAIHDP